MKCSISYEAVVLGSISVNQSSQPPRLLFSISFPFLFGFDFLVINLAFGWVYLVLEQWGLCEWSMGNGQGLLVAVRLEASEVGLAWDSGDRGVQKRPNGYPATQ
ncbi:hypothetical protein V6N13_110933 [Hibiscus sabdariffa]